MKTNFLRSIFLVCGLMFGLNSVSFSQSVIWFDSFLKDVWSFDVESQELKNINSSLLKGEITDISLDRINKHIYYSVIPDAFDEGEAAIVRTDLNGNAYNIILDTGVYSPSSIYFDEREQNIFFTETEHSKGIKRLNPDGSNLETIAGEDQYCSNILIDNGMLYWIDNGDEIWKSDKNGNNPIALFYTDSFGEDYKDLVIYKDSIYWTSKLSDWGTNKSKILVASVTGGEKRTLKDISHLSYPEGISIDSFNQKIYWCTNSPVEGIYRANLDGSEEEPFFIATDYMESWEVAEITDFEFKYELVGNSVIKKGLNRIKLFPNPTPGGSFLLDLSELKDIKGQLSIVIINLKGEKSFSCKIETKHLSQKIESGLGKGMYIVQIKLNNIILQSEKLMILD
jgi:hypothetical protein